MHGCVNELGRFHTLWLCALHTRAAVGQRPSSAVEAVRGGMRLGGLLTGVPGLEPRRERVGVNLQSPWETGREVGHLAGESGTRHRLGGWNGVGVVRLAALQLSRGERTVCSETCWGRKAEPGSPAYSRRKEKKEGECCSHLCRPVKG